MLKMIDSKVAVSCFEITVLFVPKERRKMLGKMTEDKEQALEW
jgi:hypothetical protein